MPLRLFLAAIVCLSLGGSAWAEERPADADDTQFPYDAFINADDVYVRERAGAELLPGVAHETRRPRRSLSSRSGGLVRDSAAGGML